LFHCCLYALKSTAYSSVCTNNQVRLVGGVTQYEGRVELCRNNAWGTICSYSWDNQDAQVVCRQLGYPTTNATAFSSAYFGSGTGSILYNYVGCTGHESSLASCSHSTSTYYCSHYNDAGVGCYAATQVCAYGQLRLQGSSNPREGRVEICINNNWGTVCDDGFDDRDALTICKQLGYNAFTRYSHLTIPVTKSHPIWLIDSNSSMLDSCIGGSNKCPLVPVKTCTHMEDVTIECDINTASVSSSNTLKTCQNVLDQAPEGTVRLYRNGDVRNVLTSGIVQIRVFGEWGNICDDFSYNQYEADVICHQLGYSGASAYSRSGINIYGTDHRPVLLSNVDCGANVYLAILQCSYSTYIGGNCLNSNSYDATVSCCKLLIFIRSEFYTLNRFQSNLGKSCFSWNGASSRW
jgi:deleted-in-malignant-brain-tumors protein 1